MNVVDSSGWIEYYNGGPNAAFFQFAILDTEKLIVPTMVLLEVYRHILRQLGPDPAYAAIAGMKQGRVQELDESLALLAAEVGVEKALPLADSVILATAKAFDATLWTQNADFQGMPDVKYKAKRRP